MKPKEDLTGGTIAAKTSPPLCDRSGAAGTGAPEELKLDGRLLQEDKSKGRTRRSVQQLKNRETTHRRGTRGASSSSLSSKAAIAPSEKEKSTRFKAQTNHKKTKHINMLT